MRVRVLPRDDCRHFFLTLAAADYTGFWKMDCRDPYGISIKPNVDKTYSLRIAPPTVATTNGARTAASTAIRSTGHRCRRRWKRKLRAACPGNAGRSARRRPTRSSSGRRIGATWRSVRRRRRNRPRARRNAQSALVRNLEERGRDGFAHDLRKQAGSHIPAKRFRREAAVPRRMSIAGAMRPMATRGFRLPHGAHVAGRDLHALRRGGAPVQGGPDGLRHQ
jgi:hypothetical protein